MTFCIAGGLDRHRQALSGIDRHGQAWTGIDSQPRTEDRGAAAVYVFVILFYFICL